jgi:hypothetical protein
VGGVRTEHVCKYVRTYIHAFCSIKSRAKFHVAWQNQHGGELRNKEGRAVDQCLPQKPRAGGLTVKMLWMWRCQMLRWRRGGCPDLLIYPCTSKQKCILLLYY